MRWCVGVERLQPRKKRGLGPISIIDWKGLYQSRLFSYIWPAFVRVIRPGTYPLTPIFPRSYPNIAPLPPKCSLLPLLSNYKQRPDRNGYLKQCLMILTQLIITNSWSRRGSSKERRTNPMVGLIKPLCGSWKPWDNRRIPYFWFISAYSMASSKHIVFSLRALERTASQNGFIVGLTKIFQRIDVVGGWVLMIG